MQVAEGEELRLVMSETAEALAARAAIITMHPEAGLQPSIIHADEESGVGAAAVARLLERDEIWPQPDPGEAIRWGKAEVDGTVYDTMTIPVARVPDHSRLVITAFFDDADADVRANATAVYLRRRPFAIGYFRLLQSCRAQQRRIAAMANALDVTELGVVMVDRNGGVVVINDCARRLLSGSQPLRLDRGALRAMPLHNDVRLQTVLSHVTHASSQEPAARDLAAPVISLARASGEPPLVVSVVPPEHRAEEPGDVAAILFIIDPSVDLGRLVQPICQLYGLTPVETRVVQGLISSRTVAETADLMRIKEATARGYLKTIFSKTNTSRQAELVILFLTSMVRMTRSVSFQAVP